LVAITGLAFHHETIAAEQAWSKPFKFSMSLMTYGLTLLSLSRSLEHQKKLFNMISRAALAGTIVELSAIILQVTRGTTSHFNTATQFDHIMSYVTTSAIMPVAVGMIVLYALLLRQSHLSPIVGTSLRWGFFLAIIGLVPGILMVLPDPVQDLITHHHQFDGHTIGFSDGGPGLPFLGWSTVAGDLRPVHFLGLHALQVIPLLGYLISRVCSTLSTSKQQKLLWNAGFVYLFIMLVMIWQALSAESIVAPRSGTLIALCAIILFAFISALHTFLSVPDLLVTEQPNAPALAPLTTCLAVHPE
jgi:hypothetical protein